MSGNPLKQFEVKNIIDIPSLWGIDISFTNSSFFMLLSVFISSLLIFWGVRSVSLVPRTKQALAEMFYEFLRDLIIKNANHKALKHMPFIMTMFMFILFCNLTGMLPLPIMFTVTSQFVVTTTLALMVFVYALCVTIYSYGGLAFFNMFLPKGIPKWLSPIMFTLEFSTYLFRPASLSIRLVANMIAGHTIIEVIASFTNMLSVFFVPFSFFFIVVLIIFEIFISILQAYIFVILSCVYLNDAYTEH